jgi:hypothetical protein
MMMQVVSALLWLVGWSGSSLLLVGWLVRVSFVSWLVPCCLVPFAVFFPAVPLFLCCCGREWVGWLVPGVVGFVGWLVSLVRPCGWLGGWFVFPLCRGWFRAASVASLLCSFLLSLCFSAAVGVSGWLVGSWG